MLIADETIAVMAYDGTAYDGTVLATHLRGRHREGRDVVVFGRTCEIVAIRETSGAVLVTLRSRPTEGPLMCSACGSLDLDQPGGPGDPWQCACGHRGYARGVLV